jgi:HEAT repeat protein
MGHFDLPDVERMKAERDVDGVIEALIPMRWSWEVRLQAIQALGEIGDARAVKPLLIVLLEKSVIESREAAEALRKIGTPAVESLIAALKGENADTRGKAATELGKIGDARAIEPLIAAMKDKNANVREAAVVALGKIGDARAVKPLISALGDEWFDIAKAAAEALETLGWRPGKDEAGAAYWIAKWNWEECVRVGRAAIGPLVAALADKNLHVRGEAAKALGELRDPRALEPLIAALKDNESWRLPEAAEALGKIGSARAVEPLILALQHGNDAVRGAAVEALAKIGKPAVEALLDIFDSGHYNVRTAAHAALGKIGAPAVKSLTALLKDKDEVKAVRGEAIEMLGEIGAPGVESLIGALKDRDEYVRGRAARALGKTMDVRGVKPLVAALRDADKDVRWDVANALEGLGWQPGKDQDGAAYWMAKLQWAQCTSIGAPSMKLLTEALKDKDGYVRSEAAEALGDLNDSRAVGLLIAALRDKDVKLRGGAARGLGKSGDARAVQPLLMTIRDEEPDVRKAAAEALEKIGWQPSRDETGAAYWAARQNWEECVKIGPAAIGALVTLLRGQHMGLGRAAAESLIRLYMSGQLDETHKKVILAHRQEIARPHNDNWSIDGDQHADIASLEFPL